MKPTSNRLLVALCLCSLLAAATLTACGGGDEASDEQTAAPADENLTVRQARMKEISRICGGIYSMLKNGKLDNVADDAQRLKEIMAEVAKIPPPFDTEKYVFYAADFQAKADTLAMMAQSGSVDGAKPAFNTLAQTCGVCHYTCKYPTDL